MRMLMKLKVSMANSTYPWPRVGGDATFLQPFLGLISLYLKCYHWPGKAKRPPHVPNIDAAWIVLMPTLSQPLQSQVTSFFFCFCLLQNGLDHLVADSRSFWKPGSEVFLDVLKPIAIGREIAERDTFGPPLIWEGGRGQYLRHGMLEGACRWKTTAQPH